MRDSEELDDLFRDIMQFHWIDESRTPGSTRCSSTRWQPTDLEERERAVDELLELGGAMDGLLAQQVELDIDELALSARRTFSDPEKSEIQAEQQRAYRWTFLVSGLEHPEFVQIVRELTEAGQGKIAAAAQALSA